MAAETPGSPEDYSLFLSENGHLSFENPNYQVNDKHHQTRPLVVLIYEN